MSLIFSEVWEAETSGNRLDNLDMAGKHCDDVFYSIPYAICSMKGRFALGQRWPHLRGNLGKYSLHGAFGYVFLLYMHSDKVIEKLRADDNDDADDIV